MKTVVLSRSSAIGRIYDRVYELMGEHPPECESTCGVNRTLLLALWVLIRRGNAGILRPYPWFLVGLFATLCALVPVPMAWVVVFIPVLLVLGVLAVVLCAVAIVVAGFVLWALFKFLILFGPIRRAWDWFVAEEVRVLGEWWYLHELVLLGLIAISQVFFAFHALNDRGWAKQVSGMYLVFEITILGLVLAAKLGFWLAKKEKEDQSVTRTIEQWALKADAIAESRTVQVTLTTWQTMVILVKDFKDKVCHPVQWVP